MICSSHKSNFERPHHLFGTYGEAERRKWRQDQYPATGNFGEFTGAKWHDLFQFDGTLDEDAVDMGLKALTPKAGDVLIMPEALTHGVLPWRPTDRARHALLIRFGVANNGGAANNPNNSTVSVGACHFRYATGSTIHVLLLKQWGQLSSGDCRA